MTTEQVLSALWAACGFLGAGVVLLLWAAWRASGRFARRDALRDYAELHHLAPGDSLHVLCSECGWQSYAPLEQFGEIPLCSRCGHQTEAVGFVYQPTEVQKQ